MRRLYILCLFALGMANSISSQTLEQAKQQFLKGEFSAAKPVFSNLLKKSPSNSNYNFWYGACEYETGNAENAIPYLQKGAKAKVTNAYKYLGLAYFDLYNFGEAETSYGQYIAALTKAKQPVEEEEKVFEKIKKASRMIKGVEKVTVVDSFVVDKNRFLDNYHLSKPSGKLSMISDTYGTSYETENGNNILLSQKGPAGNMQLYTQIKLINDWSKPEPVTSLQSDADINYPFLMTDGITLYYSATGPESLGGYDMFVTRYDTEDRRYLKPDNLGMPFNSPFNDYMFAIDELNNLGWFASDRYQPNDKVCIYVFIPNETKEVYDYENTDPKLLHQAALLSPIKVTQADKKRVEEAKRVLVKVMSDNPEKHIKRDFEFVIDDKRTYYSLKDFKSKEASKLYLELSQKEKDFKSLCTQLDNKRDEYAAAVNDKKSSLAPSILDLEKRTEQLQKEINQLIINIRNKEITWK